MELALVILVVVTALVFDYINGFHDAANSIATVVSTRVLSPGQAVIWAAFFNFAAAFIFGTAVAKTVGSGMIDISIVTSSVILAGLIGAIVWDLITWFYGLPTSSSHALIGAYAGAAIAKAGQLQQFWRIDGTGGDDHFAPRQKSPALAVLQDFDAGDAAVFHRDQLLRHRAPLDGEIGPLQRRTQIFGAGMGAAAVARVDVVDPRPFD